MPRLEILLLRYVAFNITPQSSASVKPVLTLPNLRRIDLIAEINSAIELLNSIDTPSARLVQIIPHHLVKASPLLTSLPEHRLFIESQYLALSVSPHKPVQRSLQLRTDVDVYGRPQRNAGVLTVFVPDWLSLKTMCGALPLHHIKGLEIDNVGPEINLMDIIGSVPSLQSLHIRGGSLLSVLKLLFLSGGHANTSPRDDTSTARTTSCIPELRLHCVRFTDPIVRRRLERIRASAIAIRGSDSASYCIGKIFYHHCPGVDSGMAVLLREITGASEDNLLGNQWL